MAELKLVSPLLSNMEVEQCLSIRGGTSVYIVKSTKSQQTYILKHISVPESQKQVDALIYTGAATGAEDAQKYYEQVVTDYREELETLESLSSSPNLECFRSYQIEPKEDGVGFDVYLLAEHRKTLVDYLAENAMTQVSAVNLGMDLCNALIDLRAAGLIHRDVKPGNIYLSSQAHFVLGDLGIAKIEGLKYCSIPEHMLSSYSAPELFSILGNLELTSDLYSVGLILYRIYNGNHGPFEDERTSAKAADKRRVTGESLPAPMYADYEMTGIILKACAFKPEDRFQTPDELKQELTQYMLRNQLADTLIAPPIVSDEAPIDPSADEETVEPVQFADTDQLPEDFKQSFSPDTQMLNTIIEAVHKDMAGQPEDDSLDSPLERPEAEDKLPVEPITARKRRKRKKKWLPFAIGGGVLVIAAALLYYFLIFAPSMLHISSITQVDKTSDTITVHVTSSEADGAFGVICSDAYGNTSRQSYVKGDDNVFTELVPGTQYTITVEPANGEKLTGEYTLMVTTSSQTEIISFTATPVSVTQAELNLFINGPDPGTWTVSYWADGIDAKTETFSGHSATIANLEANTEYTFELQKPEGTELTGTTSVVFSTVPSVDIDQITAAMSSSSVILSWTITGDAPESWTVNIAGPNDYADTQVVSAPTITFEGLVSGESYTITISSPSMLQNVSTTIVPSVTVLKSFTAEADASGGMAVAWECEADPAQDNWIVTYAVVGATDAEPVSLTVENANSATIAQKDLIPGAEYKLTLELANGDKLDGESELSFTAPEAEAFKDYNMGSVYVGMYLEPGVDNWTSKNLSTARTSFSATESVAFAMQTINKVSASSDTVTITLVVKDADGKIVDFSTSDRVWDDMWENSLCVGALPRTPQTAGTYTLQFLFNGLTVGEQSFTITG